VSPQHTAAMPVLKFYLRFLLPLRPLCFLYMDTIIPLPCFRVGSFANFFKTQEHSPVDPHATRNANK
jgi:hypothetical protein